MRRSRLSYGVTDEAVVAKATVCGGGDQLVGSTTTSYRSWIAIDRGEERPLGTTTITRVFLTSRSDTSGSYCRELGSRSLWKPSTADGESVAVRQ